MRTTQFYNLKQPEESDEIKISDLNDNMDILDRELHKQISRRTITLTAAGWSNAYPYTQTVSVPGITATDSVKVIGLDLPAGVTADQVKAWNKAAGCLVYNPGGVAAGKITFKAYKRPTVDIKIITEGA